MLNVDFCENRAENDFSKEKQIQRKIIAYVLRNTSDVNQRLRILEGRLFSTERKKKPNIERTKCAK